MNSWKTLGWRWARCGVIGAGTLLALGACEVDSTTSCDCSHAYAVVPLSGCEQVPDATTCEGLRTAWCHSHDQAADLCSFDEATTALTDGATFVMWSGCAVQVQCVAPLEL